MDSKPVELLIFRQTDDTDVKITPTHNLNGHKSSLIPVAGGENNYTKMDTEAEMESLHKKDTVRPDVFDPEEHSKHTESPRDLAKDFNIYATKKTVVQGLLDIALLTANITTLKHLYIIGENNHNFYHVLIVALWTSLVLQVMLGLFLLIVGSTTKLKQQTEALNNIISVIVYAITIINVGISIFNDETITLKYNTCMKELTRIRNGSSSQP